MIDGYVGQVLPDQILGWAFNKDHPDAHVEVHFYLGERHLGSAIAKNYRPDLAKARIGRGDHGFVFRLHEEFDVASLDSIVARVHDGSDSRETQVLPRFSARRVAERTGVSAADSAPVYNDPTQFPIFVLGAPRSGTSAVTQALIAATPYTGFQEGHVIDVLSPLLYALQRFYNSKKDDIEIPGRYTMIKKIPQEYFINGIGELMVKAVEPLFPGKYWCEKTPNADMIWSAPQLLRLWPNAKFIFCKRRPFENLASRIRKFRGVEFEGHCLAWTGCMEAWRDVRERLTGRALELDQNFLARHPDSAAEAIGALLNLTADHLTELRTVLKLHQPERTGTSVEKIVDPAELDWDATQWATFERICAPTMKHFGYSRDETYYTHDAAARACQPV